MVSSFSWCCAAVKLAISLIKSETFPLATKLQGYPKEEVKPSTNASLSWVCTIKPNTSLCVCYCEPLTIPALHLRAWMEHLTALHLEYLIRMEVLGILKRIKLNITAKSFTA